MSECKISNCAFYTCCYGKKTVVGFGQWGEMGYSQLFDPVYLSMFIFWK